ncbi:MAG: CbiX/SirB N-terminal domain-containing protein [Chthoniobacterales bacterium]
MELRARSSGRFGSALSPAKNDNALLLVTTESDVARSDEITRRLSDIAEDVRFCTFGSNVRGELAALVATGPSRILVVPFSVGANNPLLADLTGLLRWAGSHWPNVNFLLSAPVGSPEHVIGWASRQAQVAIAEFSGAVSLEETALLVVGAGATAAANAEICAMARLLWENRDYQLVEVAFAENTRPEVAEGINRLLRLRAEQIIVLPLTLFDASMYQSVQRQVDSANVSQVVLARPLLSPTGAATIVRQRCERALRHWFDGGDDGLALHHGHQHEHEHEHDGHPHHHVH